MPRKSNVKDPIGVRVLQKPGVGSATLYYYNETPLAPALVLNLFAEPWSKSGIQPFAWDFLPPVGERTYGIIRLVLNRTVAIVPPPPIVHFPTSDRPHLEVYRVQNASLVPDQDTTIDPYKLVGEPKRWKAQSGFNDPFVDHESEEYWSEVFGGMLPSFTTAVVQCYPHGLRISHDQGGWLLEISASPFEVGGFAYEFFRLPEISILPSWYIRIVHTKNVTITLENTKIIVNNNYELLSIFVYTCLVNDVRELPPQGSILDSFTYKEKQPDVIRLSARVERQKIAIETGIGFVPFIGDIYDVAQLAYTAITGRDFWGASVTDEELLRISAFTVAALLIPFGNAGTGKTGRNAVEGLRGTKSLVDVARRLSLSGIDYSKIMDPQLIEQITKKMGSNLRAALSSASDQAVNRVMQVLRKYSLMQIPLSILFAEIQIALIDDAEVAVEYIPLPGIMLDLLDEDETILGDKI